MTDVSAGTGITVSHTAGEVSTATLSIGQAVATTSDVTLDYFKCAYLNDPLAFLDKIEVISAPTSTGSVEF